MVPELADALSGAVSARPPTSAPAHPSTAMRSRARRPRVCFDSNMAIAILLVRSGRFAHLIANTSPHLVAGGDDQHATRWYPWTVEPHADHQQSKRSATRSHLCLASMAREGG